MTPLTFHLVGLPHTQTTSEYSVCAFTYKVRMFSQMMSDLGHKVYLYSSEDVDVDRFEHIPLVSKAEQTKWFGEFDHRTRFFPVEFDATKDYWRNFNARATVAIRDRMSPGDFICHIGGSCSAPVAAGVPELTSVEFGIGYEGTFAPHRVFESYAWMHYLYGKYGVNDGNHYDAVIPNYYDPSQFHTAPSVTDHLLFVGRVIERKGVHIAAEVSKATGRPLLVAGQGVTSSGKGWLETDDMRIEAPGMEYVGHVNPKERSDLMASVHAFIAPTTYIEPFGSVSVEAQLCGTPVLGPDWGAFAETVIHGETGYRCRTLDHYVWAADHARELDSAEIRHSAVERYSMNKIGPRYEEYFSMLGSLSGDGWYALNPTRSGLDWLPR